MLRPALQTTSLMTCARRTRILASTDMIIELSEASVAACMRNMHVLQQHADLFTPRTVPMRSFLAQQNHLGVSNYIIDCLNFVKL